LEKTEDKYVFIAKYLSERSVEKMCMMFRVHGAAFIIGMQLAKVSIFLGQIRLITQNHLIPTSPAPPYGEYGV
jgi:hypothetical protein